MKTKRAKELEEKIQDMESQIVFLNSAISQCMQEQFQLDNEIDQYTLFGLNLKAQIKDLRAELADTI